MVYINDNKVPYYSAHDSNSVLVKHISFSNHSDFPVEYYYNCSSNCVHEPKKEFNIHIGNGPCDCGPSIISKGDEQVDVIIKYDE